MMVNEEDDMEKPVSDEAVDELLDTEAELDEDEIDPEAKETVDEFGAGPDEDVKSTSRDWE
jgi:hypothetical protein